MEDRGPGALGFYLAPAAVKEALLGLGLGVVVGLVVVAGMVATGGLRWISEPGSLWSYLREGGASLWLFMIPAAGEEALLRGYLFQALAESWGPGRTLWFTAVAFGLLHLGNPNLSALGVGNIMVAGLFLGAVYVKTASLWWATAAHVGWNWSMGFLADLPVSGYELVNAPFIEAVPSGVDWISGGGFGPEGSIVATLFLALAAAFIWKTPALVPGEVARATQPLFLADGGPDPVTVEMEWTSNIGDTRRTT
jgi:membrane protease YdiL (CAAX protease family)